MNKKKLYNRVNVYPNGILNTKEFVKMLRDSEFEIGGKYYFEEWKKWYEIGTMMNVGMPQKGESLPDTYKDNPHAQMQKKFIEEVTESFYRCTEDYIKEYDVEIPKWAHSGISVCRYDITKKPEYLALAYHTDTHEFDPESPGNKFAVTCTMYLNDDYEGGEISFLNEQDGEVVTWKPVEGDVIVFPSNSPYFHGVHPLKTNVRYIIRLWWFWDYEGSPEWHANKEKYGEEQWLSMEKDRIKKEFDSGKWHRHVVYPGDIDPPTGHSSTPFYMKTERSV